MTENTTLVTVTGASGFIALHCVRELLREGYRVRGTVRSLDKEPAIRAALALD
ncbi:MAG: NAD-dependent epimerase/dehydratase family protein, partial [Deltaproteobacteria bacterium]